MLANIFEFFLLDLFTVDFNNLIGALRLNLDHVTISIFVDELIDWFHWNKQSFLNDLILIIMLASLCARLLDQQLRELGLEHGLNATSVFCVKRLLLYGLNATGVFFEKRLLLLLVPYHSVI